MLILKSCIFPLIFFCLAISCSDEKESEAVVFVSPHHEFLDPLLDEVAEELEERYKLKTIGFGGGTTLEGNVKLVGLRFDKVGPVDQGECRRILVESALLLLEKINSCQELQQFLSVIPFTSENISMDIFLHHADRSDIFHPNFSVIGVGWGKVDFCTNDENNPNGYYKLIIEESFEEALKIVQKEQQGQF